MIVWMLTYSASRIVLPHTPASSLAMRRHWLRWIGFPVLNLHVIIKGKAATQSAIYVANHRSFADPVVLCNFIDAYVIAKAEVANYPIINQGAKLTGVIYVKRENKESRNEVRDMMIQTVKKGNNVLVFPEGTVGVNKTTVDFRPGTFFEAAEHNVPIVPVAIEYRSEKDLWLIPNFVKLFLSQFSKWKTEVKVTIGEPMVSNDGEYLRTESRKWIDQQLHSFHNNWTQVDYSKLEKIGPLYKYKDLKKS
jgi:1-acyl-sn-glycerol-3-phosphate acyltransferase